MAGYDNATATTIECERDGFEYRFRLEPDSKTAFPEKHPGRSGDADAVARWARAYDRWTADEWRFVCVVGEMRHTATELVVADVRVDGVEEGEVTPGKFRGLAAILAEMRDDLVRQMHDDVAQKAHDYREVADLLDSFVPDEE